MHKTVEESLAQQSKKGLTFLRIMNYFKRRWIFYLGSILTLLVSIGPVAMYIIMGDLVNGLTESTDDSKIKEVVVEVVKNLAIFYTVFSVVVLIKDVVVSNSNPYFLADIRVALYEKLMSLDVSYFDATTTGGLMSTFTNDCTVVSEVYISKALAVTGGRWPHCFTILRVARNTCVLNRYHYRSAAPLPVQEDHCCTVGRSGTVQNSNRHKSRTSAQ